MDLQNYRREIDEIDRQLVACFLRRMQLSAEIGRYKEANQLPVLDEAREGEKLKAVEALCPPALRPSVHELYEKLFALSRAYQQAGRKTEEPKT